jgi:hypothetical protein
MVKTQTKIDWKREADALLERESDLWEQKKLSAAKHRMETMVAWEESISIQARKKDKYLQNYLDEWRKKPYWGPTKFL